MNLKDYDGRKPKELEPLDRMFLNELSRVINDVTKNFEDYEYSRAKLSTEQFFWKDFCDNYLELVKKRIYNGKGEKKISAQYTLYQSLLKILKLAAPITPFITEYIYQQHFRKNEKDKSIHISKWPGVKVFELHDAKWEKGILNKLIEIISLIRQQKTKAQKPLNSEIILTITRQDFAILFGLLEDLKAVTNAKEIKQGKEFKVEFI